jgi:hypothetical protein
MRDPSKTGAVESDLSLLQRGGSHPRSLVKPHVNVKTVQNCSHRRSLRIVLPVSATRVSTKCVRPSLGCAVVAKMTFRTIKTSNHQGCRKVNLPGRELLALAGVLRYHTNILRTNIKSAPAIHNDKGMLKKDGREKALQRTAARTGLSPALWRSSFSGALR